MVDVASEIKLLPSALPGLAGRSPAWAVCPTASVWDSGVSPSRGQRLLPAPGLENIGVLTGLRFVVVQPQLHMLCFCHLVAVCCHPGSWEPLSVHGPPPILERLLERALDGAQPYALETSPSCCHLPTKPSWVAQNRPDTQKHFVLSDLAAAGHSVPQFPCLVAIARGTILTRSPSPLQSSLEGGRKDRR